MIQNVEFRASARERCSEFIHDNTGSADVIMHRLQPLLERLSVTDGSVQPL